MTQTARVSAPEPVSDMLREATRLKALEPRRLAPLFALYDLPRWCVRHALWMFACACRVGCPVAIRKPVSGPALSGPIPDRLWHTCRARVLGCADVCGFGMSPTDLARRGCIIRASRHHPAIRCQEPRSHGQRRTTSDTRIARPRWGVRMCTEMYGNGLFQDGPPPTSEGHTHMTR